jgi:thymidylate kinase
MTTLDSSTPPGTPDFPRGPAADSQKLVIEFAGTPRAGKTSTMEGLQRRLCDSHLRVHIVEERAGQCRVPTSERLHFNIWTAMSTLAAIIEALHTDADVVLVDRGLFDSLCWLEWCFATDRLKATEHVIIRDFLCVESIRKLIDVVLVMTVEPAVALERERTTRPRGLSRGPGTIMNQATLCELNASIAAAVQMHSMQFQLRQLNTTTLARDEAEHLATKTVIDMIWALVSARTREPKRHFRA